MPRYRTGGTPRASWDASLWPLREDWRNPKDVPLSLEALVEDSTRALGCLAGGGLPERHTRLGVPLCGTPRTPWDACLEALTAGGTHVRLGMPLWTPWDAFLEPL